MPIAYNYTSKGVNVSHIIMRAAHIGYMSIVKLYKGNVVSQLILVILMAS